MVLSAQHPNRSERTSTQFIFPNTFQRIPEIPPNQCSFCLGLVISISKRSTVTHLQVGDTALNTAKEKNVFLTDKMIFERKHCPIDKRKHDVFGNMNLDMPCSKIQRQCISQIKHMTEVLLHF